MKIKTIMDAPEPEITAEDVRSVEDVALAVSGQDPQAAAMLQLLAERQYLQEQVYFLKFLMLGCKEHPEYRSVDYNGKLVPPNHLDCSTCGAMHEGGRIFIRDFLGEVSAPVQSNGDAGDDPE